MTALLAPLVAALAMTVPTTLIALAFGIAKDGSPFSRDFWSA